MPRASGKVCLVLVALVISIVTGLWSLANVITGIPPDGLDVPSERPTVTVAPTIAATRPPLTTSTVEDPRLQRHSVAWLRAHALQPTDAAAGHVLQLSSAALNAVQKKVTRPPSCPDRYLFVNTHTYGRHHNQLQEMLNLVAWARTLNRTAVMGWFRYNHRWTVADDLYDFSEVYRDYCAIPHEVFIRQWQATPAVERTAGCIGQGVNDTPLKGIVRKCRQQPGVPAYYNSRQGVDLTVAFLAMMMNVDTLRHARFLGVSGQIAFFLRPGLLEQVAVTTRVQLHATVRTEAERFGAANKLRFEGGAKEEADGKKPFFGLHLRQREKECGKEMSFTFEDGGDLIKAISDPETRRSIEGQCAITVAMFDDLHKRVVPASEASSLGFFLASDHQNVALEKALQSRGAVMLAENEKVSGLTALGADFYILQRAKYFAGNQLSSISQNCCFARLGRGLACHGFVTDFTLFHSRATDPSVLVPNVAFAGDV